MIDMMATRYHMLPSRILDDANTIDLYVMDMALSFEKHCNSDSNNASSLNDLSINTLEEAVKKVK